MEYSCPENTVVTNVTYMRTREGPNHFRVYYKQGCIRFTPKEVGVFGVARFTPTVNKIRIGVMRWLKPMDLRQIRLMMVILTTLLSMVLVLKSMKNQMTILRWLCDG